MSGPNTPKANVLHACLERVNATLHGVESALERAVVRREDGVTMLEGPSPEDLLFLLSLYANDLRFRRMRLEGQALIVGPSPFDHELLGVMDETFGSSLAGTLLEARGSQIGPQLFERLHWLMTCHAVLGALTAAVRHEASRVAELPAGEQRPDYGAVLAILLDLPGARFPVTAVPGYARLIGLASSRASLQEVAHAIDVSREDLHAQQGEVIELLRVYSYLEAAR